jgi:hypothetical protein
VCWTSTLPAFRKHFISFEVIDFGEEFNIQVQTTEVQSVQVFPGVLLERKECFHQCMIVLLENLGHASHFQMCFGINQAKEVPQCSEPSNFQTWDLEIWAFENRSGDACM